MADYQDHWIECTDSEIRIRAYYVPWGTKRIPYSSVKSMRRASISAMRGQFRIWGTANPRYWAGLDPRRPSKQVAFVLDLGKAVCPFVTPDDPDAFESAVRSHTDLGTALGTAPRGPII